MSAVSHSAINFTKVFKVANLALTQSVNALTYSVSPFSLTLSLVHYYSARSERTISDLHLWILYLTSVTSPLIHSTTLNWELITRVSHIHLLYLVPYKSQRWYIPNYSFPGYYSKINQTVKTRMYRVTCSLIDTLTSPLAQFFLAQSMNPTNLLKRYPFSAIDSTLCATLNKYTHSKYLSEVGPLTRCF